MKYYWRVTPLRFSLFSGMNWIVTVSVKEDPGVQSKKGLHPVTRV
jgi:hypothetical protein